MIIERKTSQARLREFIFVLQILDGHIYFMIQKRLLQKLMNAYSCGTNNLKVIYTLILHFVCYSHRKRKVHFI